MKQFFFFKKDSKWIYQNDSTMANDTVTVTEAAISSYADEDDGKINHYLENSVVKYYSTNLGLNLGLN